MWSAGKEGPTSVPKTTAQLSDIKAATDAQDALKAGIADINNKK
jgi:hypothetical protein